MDPGCYSYMSVRKQIADTEVIETENGFLYYWENKFLGKLEAEKERDVYRREIRNKLREILHDNDLELSHSDEGKPFLANYPDIHISVSHAQNHFAIYLSEKVAVGVDIETERRNILRVSDTYLSKQDLAHNHGLTMDNLQIIWGVKEAVYKKFGGAFSNAREEITITRIDHAENEVFYECEKGQGVCHFQKVDNCLYLVYG